MPIASTATYYGGMFRKGGLPQRLVARLRDAAANPW